MDQLHEIIETAVQKQVSEKVALLEKDIENSKKEFEKLKNATSHTEQPASKEEVETIRQDFIREQCANRKRNLLLLGLPESEGGEDEKKTIATLLKNRLGIPLPKIDRVYRLGATVGKNPRPLLMTFPDLTYRYSVWNKKKDQEKDQKKDQGERSEERSRTRSKNSGFKKIYRKYSEKKWAHY